MTSYSHAKKHLGSAVRKTRTVKNHLQMSSDGESESLPSTEPHSPVSDVAAGEPSAASNDRATSLTSFEPEHDEFSMIYKKIQWLKGQQKNIKVIINSDNFRNDVRAVDFEDVMTLIGNLQSVHSEEVSDISVEELSVTRLQLADMLHRTVEEEEHGSASGDAATAKQEIFEMLKQQTELSVRAVKEMEDIMKLEEEVLKTELELSELSTERSLQVKRIAERNELQKQIRENVSKNKKVEKLEKKLEHISKLLCTINQIIQSIISGSTVNWAKVSDIRALLFLVSKPIDLQLVECTEGEDAA